MMKTILSNLSRQARLLAVITGVMGLTSNGALGDHLPPTTPVLPGENHQHENHSGADFSNMDLRDVTFDGGNFSGAVFEDAQLERVSFVGATLDGAAIRSRQTDGANFTGASLVNVLLRGMEGTGVIFTDANLSGAMMDDAFFYFSDFRNVNFSGADLGEWTASDSDFRGANLSGAVNIDTLFFRSIYDSTTLFPVGYDPQGAGMVMVPEPTVITVLLTGLVVAGLLRRRKAS